MKVNMHMEQFIQNPPFPPFYHVIQVTFPLAKPSLLLLHAEEETAFQADLHCAAAIGHNHAWKFTWLEVKNEQQQYF